MPSYTSNALDALVYIRNGPGFLTYRWNFPQEVFSSINSPSWIGASVSLSFSFPATKPVYVDIETGFQQLSEAQQQAARKVLASISAVTNVRFTEIAGVGQIVFGQSELDDSSAGYAYTPSFSYSTTNSIIQSVTELQTSGDVWLNRYKNLDPADWLPGDNGYVFDSPAGSAHADLILDFTPGTDKLVLDDDIFTRLTGTNAGSALAATNLRLGTTALDADDFLVFNTSTKVLHYDADGSGVGAMVEIAEIRISGATQLSAADFLIVS